MKNITTLYTMHGHNEAHVQTVMMKMKRLGRPTLRVVDCISHYCALEGVHRLEAAARLGIAPKLVVLDPDDLVAADSLDWQDLQSGESYSAEELAGIVYNLGSGSYDIDADGILSLIFNGYSIPYFPDEAR